MISKAVTMMLPTLAESTSGKFLSTKILENSGNIFQWAVTLSMPILGVRALVK